MIDELFDALIVNWLIVKRGYYYDEDGELCSPGETITSVMFNDVIRA